MARLLATVSAILCLATLILWIHSYRGCDVLASTDHPGDHFTLTSEFGTLVFEIEWPRAAHPARACASHHAPPPPPHRTPEGPRLPPLPRPPPPLPAAPTDAALGAHDPPLVRICHHRSTPCHRARASQRSGQLDSIRPLRP